jgi:hypothetical protein
MPKLKVDQINNNKLKSFAHEFLFVEDGEEGFMKAPTISMRILKTQTLNEKGPRKSQNFNNFSCPFGKRQY